MSSTATTWLAVDTLVMVAAACGPGDRLWDSWNAFDQTASRDRLIARAAVREFERIVEGIGSTQAGIYEQLIGDVATSVWHCAPKFPSDAELAALGLDGNRLARVQRVLPLLRDESGDWESNLAIAKLRAYELDFAERKRDFLARHPIYDPVDIGRRDGIAHRLALLVPDGGESWGQDCLILADSSAHSYENARPTAFVSEDRRHLQRHRREILRITNLVEVQDLTGNPL